MRCVRNLLFRECWILIKNGEGILTDSKEFQQDGSLRKISESLGEIKQEFVRKDGFWKSLSKVLFLPVLAPILVSLGTSWYYNLEKEGNAPKWTGTWYAVNCLESEEVWIRKLTINRVETGVSGLYERVNGDKRGSGFFIGETAPYGLTGEYFGISSSKSFGKIGLILNEDEESFTGVFFSENKQKNNPWFGVKSKNKINIAEERCKKFTKGLK